MGTAALALSAAAPAPRSRAPHNSTSGATLPDLRGGTGEVRRVAEAVAAGRPSVALRVGVRPALACIIIVSRHDREPSGARARMRAPHNSTSGATRPDLYGVSAGPHRPSHVHRHWRLTSRVAGSREHGGARREPGGAGICRGGGSPRELPAAVSTAAHCGVEVPEAHPAPSTLSAFSVVAHVATCE